MVKYAFSALLMVFGILPFLTSCGETDSHTKINTNEYVFVRAINPSDNLYKYGAFRLKPLENEANVVQFDWVTVESPSSILKIESDTTHLGESSFFIADGLKFDVFYLSLSIADQASWWVTKVPAEFKTMYTTEICQSSLTKLEQLNHEDLSICFE
ncbi:hypothetical protein [Pseudoalteromonas gelatinilytica]|uniref:Uncharacterized protein n=1 Tax=Pseudoalteromonas gelatinilytica TaxID=1703256 RepID=A0ABQ1UBT9_9GAMM|nr:hypothetical protein [Pseudoalteromonas profundi]GGF12412.1 hypothetical protein GCM10008027_41570 [Pseudoalteromonas profundi]